MLEYAEIHKGKRIITYFYDERGNMVFKKKFYRIENAYKYAEKRVKIIIESR